MFLEILHPQGDPFAEPQILAMSHFAKAGIIRQLSDRLQELLQEYKILIAKKDNGADVGLEISDHKDKLRVFIHRFLLLWSVIARFCPEQISQYYPSTQLAVLVDSVTSSIDPDCADKFLQSEYVKFLKLLVSSNEENVGTAFMQSHHFLQVIQAVAWKDNMLSAQVNAVYAELKKLHCFKLHQLFVETHKELLEKLKEGNPALAAFLNHNKKARKSLRKSSQMDEEKISVVPSDKGSDKHEANNHNSPRSTNSAPHGSPVALDLETNEIKNLKALLLNKKAKSSDDEDDEHDVFPGLGHPIRNFTQSPLKPKSPEIPQLSMEDDKKPTITIDLGIGLGKKTYDDDADDEEFCNEESKPRKIMFSN